jgi:hypothetical protein
VNEIGKLELTLMNHTIHPAISSTIGGWNGNTGTNINEFHHPPIEKSLLVNEMGTREKY